MSRILDEPSFLLFYTWAVLRLRRQREHLPPWFCPGCQIDLLANEQAAPCFVERGTAHCTNMRVFIRCDCQHYTEAALPWWDPPAPPTYF